MTTMIRTRKIPIFLSDAEKRQLIDEGMRLVGLHPSLSPKKLFMRAMLALPEGRRWEGKAMTSMPKHRYEFFRAPVEAARPQEGWPPGVGGVVEDEVASPAARRRNRRWSDEDWDAVIEAAVPLYRSMPAASQGHLFSAAVRAVLPEASWPRDMKFSGSARVRFREGLLARLEIGEAAPPPVTVATVATPPPEPISEPIPEPVYSPREPGTDLRSLITKVVDTHFDALERDRARQDLVQRDVEGLRRSVVDLQGETRRIHALLVRVCEALDPALLETVAPATVATVATPVHHPAQPAAVAETKVEPPRLKVCVVGVLPDQGNRVVEQCRGVADIRHYEHGREAIVNGFGGYDLVLITRHSGHSEYDAAVKALGHQRARRLATTSTAGLVEEIRGAFARTSREFLLRNNGRTAPLKGGLG